MSRILFIDPADALPIWKQIEDGVAGLVASGQIAPGAAVPSVRDLARELRVNPATVAKAYQRLTEQGVLEVRRGEGTFVAAHPPALERGERTRRLREAAQRYAAQAQNLGSSADEALAEARRALDRISRPTGGKS